ncbi:MAG: hypothetical protein WCH04_05525 [Gammaproteobacteria bacterium]
MFGSGITDEAIFPYLMAKRLSEPVYNVGVGNTSTKQQLHLLNYLLRTYPADFRLRWLILLIFEGNDMENDYSPTAPREGHDRNVDHMLGSAFDDTLVRLIRDIPKVVRRQSVFR